MTHRKLQSANEVLIESKTKEFLQREKSNTRPQYNSNIFLPLKFCRP